jgi:hypothetical protein
VLLVRAHTPTPQLVGWETKSSSVAPSQSSSMPSQLESVAGALPDTHSAEALQASTPLQRFPSEQEVPAATGAYTGVPFAAQLSTVQGLPSFTLAGLQAPTTVTLTPALVAVLPALSVACAFKTCAPRLTPDVGQSYSYGETSIGSPSG